MNKSIITLIFLFSSLTLLGQPSKPGGAAPKKFEEFFRQDTTVLTKGRFNVYKEKDKYFLEIPEAMMQGQEILLTINTVKGPTMYISPASGIYRFEKGLKNKLNIFRVLPVETIADSTDISLQHAIERSGLVAPYYTLPIAAFGADSTSVIVDLTDELNKPTGLFPVSSLSLLNKPDPTRSGIEGVRMTDRGVVFSMKRVQTDKGTNPVTRQAQENVSAFNLEVSIEELPLRVFAPVRNERTYGFDVTTISEYDSKRFMVHRRNYINKWGLANHRIKDSRNGLKQITVYIDPIMPEPFREGVKLALKQWSGAFAKAGINEVFNITDDLNAASLNYGSLLIYWVSTQKMTTARINHPTTGEILCARMNVWDLPVNELLPIYLLQCGHTDSRVTKNLYDINVRKDIFTSMVAAELGKVFGMKPNFTGLSAYSVNDLRNNNFLSKNGMTASVTAGVTFNYVVQPGDKVNMSYMMPAVSTYDYDAINFAYGTRRDAPSLSRTYYTQEDQYDPFARANNLSSDPLEAYKLGIENIKRVYPDLISLAKKCNVKDETWTTASDLVKNSINIYGSYIGKIAGIVAGRTIRPIPGQAVAYESTFIGRETQLEALEYLKQNAFDDVPKWLIVDKNLKAREMDINGRLMYNVDGIFNHLLNIDVIYLMSINQQRNPSTALSVSEYFDYFDRAIFDNFDYSILPSAFKRNVQVMFVNTLAKKAFKHNIGVEMNDVNNQLHAYLLRTAIKVREAARNHPDPLVRENYTIMDMNLKKEFFEKSIK